MQLIRILIFILVFFSTSTVYAHGDEPRLEISVERINPGGVIDIRGADFDYEEAVTLSLERPGILIQAGEVIADVEGVFVHTMILPSDLPEGIYHFRAATDHHEAVSAALMIQGTAITSEEGGQGGRDEDDNLLAPMPTFAPGVVPGGVSQPAAAKPSRESTASRNWNIPVLISSFLFSIGIFLWLKQRFAQKR